MKRNSVGTSKAVFLSGSLYLFSPSVLCRFFIMESDATTTPVDHLRERKHKTLG